MSLKLYFICQASNEIGYGHLTRTCNFINKIKDRREVASIDLCVISESDNLDIEKRYNLQPVYFNSEDDIIVEKFDLIFLDCVTLGVRFLELLKSHSRAMISLSPVFNNYDYVDYLFTRSTYKDTTYTNKVPANIRSGAEFTLLGNELTKTTAGRYEENLMRKVFSIGICMGATDPLNMTKLILKVISEWKQPCLIWVAVGDGYKHDVGELKSIAINDSNHELVIVSTNDSFWPVFQNSSVLILQGGVTTYEAAYCGIPSINIPRSVDHMELTSDLLCRELTWVLDFNKNNYDDLLGLLNKIYLNKSMLMDMHFRLKHLIDDQGPQRVMDDLLSALSN
jgi:spore coat polysaccharide biosynthesis predicted glycosyltransferase SpsG